MFTWRTNVKIKDTMIRSLMIAIMRLQYVDVGSSIETDNPAEAKHPMNKPIEGLMTFTTSDPRIAVNATPKMIPQSIPMTLSLVAKSLGFLRYFSPLTCDFSIQFSTSCVYVHTLSAQKEPLNGFYCTRFPLACILV